MALGQRGAAVALMQLHYAAPASQPKLLAERFALYAGNLRLYTKS
ncbi:hypothetical protein [Desulfotruncus alcoholivorax]|nr:hypothetical protein [Desulfotruncus alcoholivorax]